VEGEHRCLLSATRMKRISETKALNRLTTLISSFKSEISDNYEHRAKSCATCEVKGSCCLDAHFVNVNISRLEAVAINRAIDEMPEGFAAFLRRRISKTIAEYQLSPDAEALSQTYACPLFEKGLGCLVHTSGKPIPCIAHACYESAADLPPIELQHGAERAIDDLNTKTYGVTQPWLPLPLALEKYK
jgi:hypothetical protein